MAKCLHQENGGMLPASCFRSQNSVPSQGKIRKEEEDQVLLNITVELDDGVVKHIAMMEGDTAESVARRFCTQHKLPVNFIEPLTDHIVANVISISQQDQDITFFPKMQANPVATGEKHKEDGKTGGWIRCPPGADLEDMGVVRKTQTPVLESKLSDRILSHTACSKAKFESSKDRRSDTRRNSSPHERVCDKSKAVYMRLYQGYLAQKKKQDDLKKATRAEYWKKLAEAKYNLTKHSLRLATNRERKALQFENYGEMLYEEGIDHLIRRIHQEQLGHKEAEARELASYTGSPEISKFAQEFRTHEDKVWIRLFESNKPSQAHLQELRNEMFEAEFMECTFKPRVNRYEREANLPRTAQTRFKQLFLDADSRRVRREAGFTFQDKRVYTFCPKINHHINPATGIKEVHYEGSVFDRLLTYAAKLTEKRQKWQQSRTASVRESHVPRTGRLPRAKRPGVIWEALYNFQWLYNKKRGLKMEGDAVSMKQLASCRYVTRRSKRVLDELKNRKFQQIFQHLDSDKDGVVEMNKADLASFDESIVPDLTLVKKLAADQPLKLQDFVKVMKAAERYQPGCNSLSFCHYLFKKTVSQKRRMVKINHVSRMLAVRTRQFSSNRQWYRMLLSDLKRKQERLDSMRKELQRSEMAECTFSPRLNHKKPRGLGKTTRLKGASKFPHSRIHEKDEQELHGFIFREAHGQAWVTGPSGATSLQPKADNPAPMAMLKSFKEIVDKSLDRP